MTAQPIRQSHDPRHRNRGERVRARIGGFGIPGAPDAEIPGGPQRPEIRPAGRD
jgi:hypothetical protein